MILTSKTLITMPKEHYFNLRQMGNFEEANYLYHMASKGGKILEVGTGPGRSSLLMKQSMVDHNVPGEVYTIGWHPDQSCAEFRAVPRLFAANPGLPVHYCVARSEEVHQNFPDGQFDFVYIDGDHSYEGVVRDIQNYKSKVKPGGVMAFHDTDKEEVQRAINQYLNWTLVAEVSRTKGYSCVS